MSSSTPDIEKGPHTGNNNSYCALSAFIAQDPDLHCYYQSEILALEDRLDTMDKEEEKQPSLATMSWETMADAAKNVSSSKAVEKMDTIMELRTLMREYREYSEEYNYGTSTDKTHKTVFATKRRSCILGSPMTVV